MSAFVAAARKYLGTPFKHRGRTSRGLDCAGLAWLAYVDCGMALPDFRKYGREPSDDGLLKHVSAALGTPIAVAPVRSSSLQVGDVIIMRFEVEPHHVAIVTDYPFGGFAIIHACGHNDKVIEQRLSDDMVKRITHVFRKPA
jgi:cell wall-associated NlpC family hydrolase